MLVLVIGCVFQACISIATLQVLKQSLMRDRITEVTHLVQSAYSVVEFYHNEEGAGRMSEASAQTAARNAIRAMRFDGTNYFCIWTLDGVGVVHGGHPEWEGRRFVNSADARKFPGVALMVSKVLEVAKSPAKEGISRYQIPKAGETTPLDKVAYSRLFVPWGWSVGAGAYIDDINATFRTQVFSLLGLFVGLIAAAGVITFGLWRDLARALTSLSSRVVSVAEGELDGEIPEIGRTDEVGVMARALMILRDNSREAVALMLDQLTGLPNRKLLTDRLKQAMSASSRSGNHGGLMFIDLDKFKTLNDTQGHDLGDMLLRDVGARLLASVREGDTVARLGGDEFVIVLIDIGHNQEDAAAALETTGEHVLAVLNQPFQLGNITHVTSASIGLALFKDDRASVEDVLKQADLAMYKAKESGRNACRFFDPHMEEVTRERVALEADLLLAIAEEQFQLHYQPQVGSSGRLVGAEALIRWNHPTRGVVPPIDFIPFAEETGLILPIGRWVLECACSQLVAWAADPATADLKIAVNVSTRQFQQVDFVEQVVATLKTTAANPNRLDLELTESLLIESVDEVIEKMAALRALGVSITLDDFGTGYSSLFYLKRMPLDQLKIDRTFVRDVILDENDAAIAKTVVALARALGLGVVAEGVETAEQRDVLADFGCRDYQGYFYSPPLPTASFEEFVRRWDSLRPLRKPIGRLATAKRRLVFDGMSRDSGSPTH